MPSDTIASTRWLSPSAAVRAPRAFGLHVCVVDPYLGDPGIGVEVVADLDTALRTADVVSLHLPLDDDTRNLVGQRELKMMPPGSILINAGEGGLVDESALLKSFQDGHMLGAGLDTFDSGPLPADSPLRKEPRIVLSPHAPALTAQAMIAMGLTTVENALPTFDRALN